MSVDDKCHVLHIASGDLWAGAEVQLATLAITTHARGLARVSVILLNHGRLEQELIASGIPVTVLDETVLGGIAILRQLMSAIRSLQPDIVHTHRMKENILGTLAAVLANRPASLRTAHGATEHAASWYQPRGLIIKLDQLIGRYLQQAVIAVTSELADKLRADFPADKLHVIHNGVDTNIASGIEASPDNKVHIGIVGRLTPVKRIDLFMQCAAELIAAGDGRQYHFHVYGDGPLAAELSTLSESLALQQHLSLHGHSDTIHRDIAALDVLMMTSDHEGLPMTLLESMCLGTAVVVHAVDALPEILDGGRCGVLVSQHEAKAYAAAVSHLLDDADRAARMVDAARQRVEQLYSAEANAEAVMRLYREILNRRR